MSADRRRRDVQFFGRTRERALTRNGLKCPQGIERGQAMHRGGSPFTFDPERRYFTAALVQGCAGAGRRFGLAALVSRWNKRLSGMYGGHPLHRHTAAPHVQRSRSNWP
ncbi:hypothetical protein PBS_04720 [Paraburkholderia sp. 2C]